MTCRWDTLGTVFHQDSGPSSRKPDSGHRLIPPSSRRALPYPGPKLHQTRELHHSTSSVMLAMPSNVRQNESLFFHISSVPSFPTHWQNGFRLYRKQNHQLCEVFPIVRNLIRVEPPSIQLSLRHFSAGPMEFRTFHVQLLKLCFRPQESESNFVERESTSMVSCVAEDKVRLVRSHCVLRHLCARGRPLHPL